MAMTSQGVGHLEKIQHLIFFTVLALFFTSYSDASPITRQVGISENVFITVQNDTYGIEQRVCSIDSVTYEDGDSIPTSSPCEHCICRPPGFACTIISCEYRPGCKALKRSNQCCPEYQCECEKDGKIYQNGEKILDNNNPCEVCYCQGGDVVCAVIDCYWRSDCQPRYIENRCCPLYDHCPPSQHPGHRLSTSTQTPFPSSWFNKTAGLQGVTPEKRVPTFTRRPTTPETTTTTTTESTTPETTTTTTERTTPTTTTTTTERTTPETTTTTTSTTSTSPVAITSEEPIVQDAVKEPIVQDAVKEPIVQDAVKEPVSITDNFIEPPSVEPPSADSVNLGEDVVTSIPDSISPSVMSEESMSFTTWNTEITHTYPTNVVEDFTATSSSSQYVEASATSIVQKPVVALQDTSEDVVPTSVSESMVTATESMHVIFTETPPSSENVFIVAAQTNYVATPELTSDPAFVLPSKSVPEQETVSVDAPFEATTTSSLAAVEATLVPEFADAPAVADKEIQEQGPLTPEHNAQNSASVDEHSIYDHTLAAIVPEPIADVQGPVVTVEDSASNTINSIASNEPYVPTLQDEPIKNPGSVVDEKANEIATPDVNVVQDQVKLAPVSETTVETVTEIPDVAPSHDGGAAQVVHESTSQDALPGSPFPAQVSEAEPTVVSEASEAVVTTQTPQQEEIPAFDAIKEPSAVLTPPDAPEVPEVESHADAVHESQETVALSDAVPVPLPTELVPPVEESTESEKLAINDDVTTAVVPESVTEVVHLDAVNDQVPDVETTQQPPLKEISETAGAESSLDDEKVVATTLSPASANDDTGYTSAPVFDSVVETTLSPAEIDAPVETHDVHDEISSDDVGGGDDGAETSTSFGNIVENLPQIHDSSKKGENEAPVRDETVESVTPVFDFAGTTTGPAYSDNAVATTGKSPDSEVNDAGEESVQADDAVDYHTTYSSVPVQDDVATERYSASPEIISTNTPNSEILNDDLNAQETTTSASGDSTGVIFSDEPIETSNDDPRETTQTSIPEIIESVDLKFDNVPAVTESEIQFHAQDTTALYSDAVAAETEERFVTTDASTVKDDEAKITSQRIESNEINAENLSSKFRLDPSIFSDGISAENAGKDEKESNSYSSAAMVETTFRPAEEKDEIAGSPEIVYDPTASSSDIKQDFSSFETTTNSRIKDADFTHDKSRDTLNDFENAGYTTTGAALLRDSADETTFAPLSYGAADVTEPVTVSSDVNQDEPEVSTLGNPDLLQRHHLLGHDGTHHEEDETTTGPVLNFNNDAVEVTTSASVDEIIEQVTAKNPQTGALGSIDEIIERVTAENQETEGLALANDDVTTESLIQSDQAEETTERSAALFRSGLPISSEETEANLETVKSGEVKLDLEKVKAEAAVVTSSPQNDKSIEAATEEAEERDSVDSNPETTPHSAFLHERNEDVTISHDLPDQITGETTIVNAYTLSNLGGGEEEEAADAVVDTTIVVDEDTSTKKSHLNASIYDDKNEASNIVISSLPNDSVKKIDPIIDDLGPAGGLGRADLTLQESMKSEQNDADEAWYWRAMNRIRNLPHFFPSVRSRSPRTG